jgi:mannose-6-phosphate isomerase-like protein (cupin superfamily)
MSPFIVYAAIALIILFAALGGIYYTNRASKAAQAAYKEFHINILTAAKINNNFRTVLATAAHGQVVLMSLTPGESIGLEHHDVDQFLIFVEGTGKALIDNKEYPINPGELFMVPAHAEHNFTNTGSTPMKLFTVYAPAQHKQGLIQKTKPQNGY